MKIKRQVLGFLKEKTIQEEISEYSDFTCRKSGGRFRFTAVFVSSHFLPKYITHPVSKKLHI